MLWVAGTGNCCCRRHRRVRLRCSRRHRAPPPPLPPRPPPSPPSLQGSDMHTALPPGRLSGAALVSDASTECVFQYIFIIIPPCEKCLWKGGDAARLRMSGSAIVPADESLRGSFAEAIARTRPAAPQGYRQKHVGGDFLRMSRSWAKWTIY